MNCKECGDEIRRGERHVSIARNVETLERGNLIERARGRHSVITVQDSESLADFHERCAPPA